MHSTLCFVVSGQVQGVGFRAATCDRARALGLAGWVRNLADGRVEVCAAGSDQALDTLRSWLAQGPPAARVDDVEQRPAADDVQAPQPFAIR